MNGIQAGATDMHTIKLIDREAVIRAAGTGAVVTAEDHSHRRSGLGGRRGARGVTDQDEDGRRWTSSGSAAPLPTSWRRWG